MKTMTSTAIAVLFLPTIVLATSAVPAVAAGATAGASTGATGGASAGATGGVGVGTSGASTGATGGASAGATGGVGVGTSGSSTLAPNRQLAVGAKLPSYCSHYRILNGRSYCYSIVGQRRVMIDSHTHRIVRILP